MSTKMSEIGGNTHVVSTGTNNYLWIDKNNDKTVDKGDLLVRTAQGDQSTYTHVVGNDEATYAWGDPHLNNKTYTGAEGKQIVAAFSDVFKKGASGPSQAALANVDKTVTTVGKDANIFDFHSSMELQLTDGTNVRYTTVLAKAPNDKKATDGKSTVAYTESVDIDVTDATGESRTIRLGELYTGNGGANASAVSDAGRRTAKDIAMPRFYELKGANAMHGVQMFGEAAGTAANATVVDNKGKVNECMGKMTPASIRFHENLVQGNYSEVLLFALTLRDSKEDEEVNELRKAVRAPATQTR